jgi:hypothetical protein
MPSSATARLRASAVALVATSLLAGGAACRDTKPTPAEVAPTATASASASASARVEDPGESSDEVRPVYPFENKPPMPLAEEYCNAVRETPKKRRQECCPNAGAYAPTGECIRTLSFALRSGAVTLDKADVDACAAAVARETAGCDWVTSVGSRNVGACLGILRGTLKEGALCRSNLECEEGLRCRGLSAVIPGHCAAPQAKGGLCNVAVDSLASFTGQDDFEGHHPECTGSCARRRCQDAVAVGAPCTASFECGPNHHCAAQKCVAGPLPLAGQPCTDACAPSVRCLKGTCVTPKGGGEACESDAECRGRCDRGDGGKAGQCAGDCPRLPTPPPARKPPAR